MRQLRSSNYQSQDGFWLCLILPVCRTMHRGFTARTSGPERRFTENFKPINDYNFIVFSNDIEYSKSVLEGGNIWFVNPEGEGVCTNSEKEDLVLMSLCDHHIIANSSYSWWGAFLSKNPNKSPKFVILL